MIQLFGFRSGGTIFCEGTLWLEKQVNWRRHYQDARVSSWQHFRGLRGKGFPTDNRHSHGHKLCPSPSWYIFMLVRSGIHTVLLSAGKKRLASQLNCTYRYINDVLSINNPDFENYLGQMYPPELEIKDETESNISASTWICSCQSIRRSTSHFPLRQTWRITHFKFLNSNNPSLPAYGDFISQLIWYARACSSYECFILRAVRLSNKLLRDLSRNVSNRLKVSSMVSTGILPNNTRPPLLNVIRHSGWWPYSVTPSIDKTLHQFLTVTDLDNITEFDFLPNCARLPKNICNGCGIPKEDAYSSGHLVLFHFGTCMCSNVEANLSPELVLFPDVWISNTPRYFSFALKCFLSFKFLNNHIT